MNFFSCSLVCVKFFRLCLVIVFILSIKCCYQNSKLQYGLFSLFWYRFLVCLRIPSHLLRLCLYHLIRDISAITLFVLRIDEIGITGHGLVLRGILRPIVRLGYLTLTPLTSWRTCQTEEDQEEPNEQMRQLWARHHFAIHNHHNHPWSLSNSVTFNTNTRFIFFCDHK